MQRTAKVILKKFFDDPVEEDIVFIGDGTLKNSIACYEALKKIEDVAEGSHKVIHYQRGKDKKFYPLDIKKQKGFQIQEGDILHIAYLPHGAEVLSRTLRGAAQGFAAGYALGTIIPGVGNVIVGFVGGVLGAIGGFFSSRHEVNTRRQVKASVNNSLKIMDYVQKLRSVQPVRITPQKKLESKQLDKVYNDKRVNPGDFVPEIFGALRIKPNAITPLYETDRIERFNDDGVLLSSNYEYHVIYSLGEGDLDVEEDLVRYNRRRSEYYDFDLSRLSDRRYKGRDESFTIRGSQKGGSEYEDYTEINFSGTDSSGLKISSDLSLEDSEDESESFNYQIILDFTLRASAYSNNLVSGAVFQGENWIFNYYEALKDSDDNVRTFKTEKAAIDALNAGSGGVEFVNITPGGVPPGGWGSRSWSRITGSGNSQGTIDNADAVDSNILAITDQFILVKDGTTAPTKITIDGADYTVDTTKHNWNQSNFGQLNFYTLNQHLPAGSWNNVKLTYSDGSVSPSGAGGSDEITERVGGFAYERVTDQFLALYPKKNSKLPIFLFEKTYDEMPDRADILPNGMTISNRRSNSTYELKILKPDDLKQRIFSDLNINIRTQNSSILLAGKSYRIFRLAWDDIKPSGSLDEASSIDLDSLTALGAHNILGSKVSIIKRRSDFVSIGEGNLTIKAKGETFFEVQGSWKRRAPPPVPEYEDPPIPPGAEFNRISIVGFDPEEPIREGDESEFSTLTTIFPMPTQNYIRDLEDYTEDVEAYNIRVTREQERYLKRAQDWQNSEQEFNERFNDWINGVANISIFVEREIKRSLLDENSTEKTDNPADIFIHILESWIKKIKIRTALDEIIDKQSFLEWRKFCKDESIKFSGSFDFDTTVFDALKSVAFVGFGEIDFSFGKMRIIINRKRNITSQYFHARNLKKFSYTRRQIEVPDLIKAQFLNKDRFYLLDEIKLYLNGTDASTARDQETISLFGVTDRKQAMRYLKLQKNQYEMLNEIWTFETDLQGIVAKRGDLVGLNYYEEEESNFTARVIRPILEDRRDEEGILKTYILGVQIDQTSVPELDKDQRYSCRIITKSAGDISFNVFEIKDTQVETDNDRIADDKEQILKTRDGRNIKARPKSYKSIMFDNAVLFEKTGISAENYVMFGKQNLVFRQCLINSISIDKNLRCSVSLIPYDERVFDY